MNDKLLQEVVGAAAEIAPAVLADFCDRLEKFYPGIGEAGNLELLETVSQPAVRERLRRLLKCWQAVAPTTDPAWMAAVLRAAGAADENRRQHQQVELVWTGPATESSHFRRTDQAMLELIQDAKQTIELVTFAAYKVPLIADALRQAAARGVEIRLILESEEESAGKVAYDAIHALGAALIARTKVYFWPKECRERDAAGRHGSLHAKCAVADGRIAFISSANLTDYAMNLNMELGVLIRGGPIPRQISDHLRLLIATDVLRLVRKG